MVKIKIKNGGLLYVVDGRRIQSGIHADNLPDGMLTVEQLLQFPSDTIIKIKQDIKILKKSFTKILQDKTQYIYLQLTITLSYTENIGEKC